MSKIQVVWFRDLTRWDTEYFMGNHFLHSKFKLEYLSKILTPRKEKIKPDEYDGITPIVAKIPFQSSHIELRKEPKTRMDMYAIYKDDLLVSNINFHQGAIAICRENKIYASTHYQPYLINNALVNSEFLVLVLKQNSYQQYISTKKTRGIKTESNFNFIKNLQIPLPPLEIQNKIVADIHAVQDKIKALQEEEKRLKDEIEAYIYITLGLQKPQNTAKQKVFVVRFKDLERWDISYNQNIYKQDSKNTKIDTYFLQELCDINPSVDMKELIKQDKNVSFIPMEVLENNGKSFAPLSKKASLNKGFTKFQNDDLLWAKITPCMQNKKSVVVSGLENGVGFGSTEFFVLRAKDFHKTDIHFILQILRTDLVIERAKLHFKGSAGQQRVPKDFLENLQIPLPPLDTQKEIVRHIEQKTSHIQKLTQERIALRDSIESKLQEMLID